MRNETYTYGNSTWKDQLTAYDGQTITYDGSGNPLSYYNGRRHTFTWQNGRQLASTAVAGTTVSYTYDGNGLRTGKNVNGTVHNYLYAGDRLVRETYGSNTLDFYYDHNGRPYALDYNGTLYYYILNLQGDVMALVDENGTEAAAYRYDPYGRVIYRSSDLAFVNPLQYRGYYYDLETGFYYLQSRYYDPQIRRFINADAYASTGQGIVGCNMYAYCGNNPVNGIDKTGSCTDFWFFRIDCFNCMSPTSSCYNPDPLTAVIIYDCRQSGTQFRTGEAGEGFAHQGKELAERLSGQYVVTLKPVSNADEFIAAWNSSFDTDNVYILCHGRAGRIVFDKTGLSASTVPEEDRHKYRYFHELNEINVPVLVVLACNGATPDDYGNSVAQALQEKTGGVVHAVKNGGLNFTWNGCIPFPSGFGYWVRLDLQ